MSVLCAQDRAIVRDLVARARLGADADPGPPPRARPSRAAQPAFVQAIAPAVRPGDLTPRERDVARLLVEGFRNEEIGDQCGCTGKTVRRHVENILGKLGARNRTHAAALLVRRELAD